MKLRKTCSLTELNMGSKRDLLKLKNAMFSKCKL